MLTDLIDQPANSITRQLLFAATAVALSRWEPRLKLTRVGVSTDNRGGAVVIDIAGERRDLPAANDHLLLSIPIRRGGAALAATSKETAPPRPPRPQNQPSHHRPPPPTQEHP